MRKFVMAVAVCLGASLAAAPAIAVPPQHMDLSGTGSIELPGRCSFPVRLDYSSKEHATAFFDQNGDLQWIGTQGRFDGTLVNEDTGQSITVNISGPAKTFPDGSVTYYGPTLIAGPGNLLLAHGKIVTDPTGMITSITGQETDLCPLLGG